MRTLFSNYNNHPLVSMFTLFVLLFVSAVRSNDFEIEHKPLKIWGAHEMGMLQGLQIHGLPERLNATLGDEIIPTR